MTRFSDGVDAGPRPNVVNSPIDHRQALSRRLDDGYQRIDDALRMGRDVDAWEGFWIQLLGEYEAVCEEWSDAA